MAEVFVQLYSGIAGVDGISAFVAGLVDIERSVHH